MSTFNYLVTVDTERDGGLIASRYEQSEKIMEALEEAEAADLSGIGARSDSAYSVASIEIVELDKRDMKKINADYDQAVRDAEPDDETLRRELKAAKDEAKEWKDKFDRQKKITDKLLEDPLLQPTKVYQRVSYDRDAVPTYLADGKYDAITFQFGEDRFDGSFDVVMVEDGTLEIRSTTMGQQLVVIPWSGNVVRLKVI